MTTAGCLGKAELVEAMQPHETEIRETLAAGRQDGENIRALARIAEIHERRLSRLEGPDNGENA